MSRIAVIGAGVVGASVAFHLVKHGATVTLIDRGKPGDGTTSRSFAWLNANRKTPRAYFDLNVAGMAEHKALAETLPPGDWLHPGGNLIWANPDDASELRKRVALLSAWGYAAEMIDAATVQAKFEPELVIPDHAAAVAYFAEEQWAEAPRLTQALIAEASKLGLTVRSETEVTAITVEGDKVTSVQLAGDAQLAIDAVVNAAGVGATDVSRLAGVPLRMAPTPGLLVRISVDGNPVGRVIHTPSVNLRPDGPGRILLHHDSFDARLGERREMRIDDPLVMEVVDEAVKVVPAPRDAAVYDVRVGVRPITSDGYPSAGALPALCGYYEAVTHSGVTLGPLLGRLVADEVLTGRVDPMLATFRPERFGRR